MAAAVPHCFGKEKLERSYHINEGIKKYILKMTVALLCFLCYYETYILGLKMRKG